MKTWFAKLLAPTAVGVAIGGVATFFGTEAVKYYYFERNEVTSQVKQAREAINPFLHPLPQSVRESRGRIIGLRGKRLLFQSREAKELFALAIGHLDEYQETLKAKEFALAEQKRRRARLLAAKRGKDAAAIKRARRAATEQDKRLVAAKKAALKASRVFSKLSKFKFKKR